MTRTLALIAILWSSFVMSGIVPQGPATTGGGLAAAVGRLQARDPQGAVALLEPLVAAEPKNGRAWRVLASAYQQLKAYDKAIGALKTSLDVDPTMPGPLYTIGALYAQKGDADQAFAWLTRAKASRKIDMSQLETDANVASIKSDARFAALRPAAADFRDPFVEPVAVLREWDGEAGNDQFGWIARNIGDVDGDGVADVVTSAPTSSAGGESAGRVYVYSTKASRLLWAVNGQPNDQLGTGLEGAGDTNRDGIPDVIASAPGSSKAYVYSGRDGRVLLTFSGDDPKDNFGRHVSAVGDVDKDGHADVIVGAPGNNAGGQGAGRAYVYSGKDGHVLLTLSGEREGDGFGSTVAGSTSARHLFLVVGAARGGATRAGRTYVYTSLASKPAFTIEADETGAALGAMFVSIPGDMDGDGTPDIYASDWSNAAKGPSTGRIYVHSGKDGRRLRTLTGETTGEGFGTSPSVAGDVDGDGAADLIVGAWQYSGAALGAGRAYLYSGKDGRLVKTFTCRTPGDAFGFDAVNLGDTDGDGTIDFLITSGWSGVHGFHSGRVFVVSSGIKRSSPGGSAARGRVKEPRP